MFKLKPSEIKQIFNKIDVSEVLDLDLVKSEATIEKALVIGIIEFDVTTIIELDHQDSEIKLFKGTVIINAFRRGEVLPIRIDELGFKICLENLEKDIVKFINKNN